MAVWMFNSQTAQQLGIEGSPVIERHNMATDVCRVRFNRAIDAGAPWAYEQRVVVSRDGHTVFTGFADEPALSGDAGGEGMAIEIKGPWWKMERTLMVQVAPGFSLNVGTVTGRRRLFVGADDGLPMTTREMLTEVLNYAKEKGCFTTWTGINELEDGIYPIASETVDRTVAEIVREVMRYHVDVAISFRGNQQLVIRKRSAAVKTFTIGTPPLTAFTLKVREDMKPTGVFIRYEERRATQTPGAYKNMLQVDRYPTGTLMGQTGVLSLTVQLEPLEPVPVGLARQYYEMFRLPEIVEGSVELTGEECDSGVYPSDNVSIRTTAGGTLFSRCFVQSVTENTALGTTEVTVGLAGHLGLSQFIDIIRRRHLVTRDNTDGDPLVIEVPSTGLTPYLAIHPITRRWVLRVTPGSVHDGLSEHVPRWLQFSTKLDATIPPELALARGQTFDIYLLYEFRPTARLYNFTDENGDSASEWGFDEEGELADLSIQIIMSSPRAAFVDPISGSVTTGRWFRKIGRMEWPGVVQLPTLIPKTPLGDHQLMHRPPSRLMFIPMA